MKYLLYAAALTAFQTSQLFAGMVLPMEYYEPRSPINSLGKKVIVGVEPEITENSELLVHESTVLFYAPKRAIADVTDVQKNITANCSVIENDIAIEAEASAMNLEMMKELKLYREMLKEYDANLQAAIADCVAATQAGDADADRICDTKSKIFEIKTELASYIAPLQDLVNGIMDQTNARLESYGKQPGGVANAVVSLYDAKDIVALEEANPGYTVKVVPISSMSFAFNPSMEDITSVESMPKKTTLGFSLAGQVNNPDGPNKDQATIAKISSGSASALSITLSRIGACNHELLRSGVFDYTYPTYGYLKGSAVFNKWQIYTRMEENSSKGGFFSSKAVHKLYEDMKGERGFKFAAFTDDDTDLDEMKERIQARLLDQLLTDFAEITTSAPGILPAGLPNPPQSGAKVGGDALLTCPHVYCQAAGYGLKTLDAIFGRSVSRAEAKREMNVTVSEEFGHTHRYSGHESAATTIAWKF